MRRRTRHRSVAAAGAAVTARALPLHRLFVKHYPPTPYDDVLARLDDRDPGGPVRRGGARRAGCASAGGPAARPAGRRLAAAAQADIAANRLAEADGWLVPESVMLLAALAART